MSIQKKFLFLILSSILAFIFAAGSYFIVVSPVSKIENEEKTLVALGNAFRDLKAAMGRIDNAPFANQIVEIDDAEQTLAEVYGELAKMQYLPEANQTIKKSIGVIANLKDLLYSNWNEYGELVPEMVEYANKLLMTTDTIITEAKLDSTNMTHLMEDGTVARAKLTWMRIISQASIIDTNLSSCISVLDEQFELIDYEIEKIEQRSLLIALGIVILVMVVVFIVFLIFTNRIAAHVREIEAGIDSIASGNLYSVIHVNSKDELAHLSGNLNKFTYTLKSEMGNIKSSADRNRDIKDFLTEEVANTIIQVDEIGGKTDTIAGVMQNLQASIQDSSEGVEVLGTNVDKMTNEIAGQLAMVEESSSAVHQMIASIGNVADITEKKRTATNALVDTARQGGRQLEKTTRIVREIHDSVDEISGTAAVIQSVASQTNLLAMNAAIEAAHAGDAGRGFAVVADEIRKLAETSSLNSKRISGVIKEVIANIEGAVASGTETSNAFSAIDAEVQGVSQSLNEISGSMSELNTGGEQILKAMDELQNVSTVVTGSSREIGEISARFESQVNRINDIAVKVGDGTKDIEFFIKDIVGSMDKVGDLSDSLDDVSEALTDEVNGYRLNEDEGITELELPPGSAETEISAEPEAGEKTPVVEETTDSEEELLFEEYKGDSI